MDGVTNVLRMVVCSPVCSLEHEKPRELYSKVCQALVSVILTGLKDDN